VYLYIKPFTIHNNMKVLHCPMVPSRLRGEAGEYMVEVSAVI
jgi:hypothetical protein